MKLMPGTVFPLGATYDGNGTNFAIFSETADKVQLCLFDENGKEERIDLTEQTAYCWHCYITEIQPGQRYGYRIHGPWDPANGHRFNPAKLLLDPYAKAIEGNVNWDKAVFPYAEPDPLSGPDKADSAPFVPRSLVTDPYFDWAGSQKPNTPFDETVIYETHVKGFSQAHPEIPEEIRGTYAALGHPAAIEYFKKLGVTAIELLPVHHFVHDHYLVEKGLKNYWGYNSIGYFAPHSEYAPVGRQVQHFKQMVKALHEAGIEVILDVVYNHTAEGNHFGPMLSFRGIDNRAYYRLVEETPQFYMDYTGTGNSLNMRHPHALQMVMDSLRYWITDMQVDGFRFDLASTLARELHDVDRLSSFFDIIQQDPLISQVKLIAEPWDVGEGGYQVGKFPPKWCEWNGKYRDTMRDFWRSAEGTLPKFARRFTGSAELYENTGRRPYASVNFITAHDGFTLNDLVSYNDKHNEQNQQNNEDGTDDNRAWNSGHEGATDDENINRFRQQRKRNFLATLLLSQGMPMLLGGDEFSRTQHGNNNAYCQDNEISWFNWENTDEELAAFTAELIDFRRQHPVFRRRHWFGDENKSHTEGQEIEWFQPNGEYMQEQSWADTHNKCITIFLSGDINAVDRFGELIVDDDFLVFFNAALNNVEFVIPTELQGKEWVKVLDTADGGFSEEDSPPVENTVNVVEHSMVVLFSQRQGG